MNSNLYNRIAIIPDSLIKHLSDCFASIGGNNNIEGYKRNQDLTPYLTQSSASSIYLTQINASTIYATQVDLENISFSSGRFSNNSSSVAASLN